MPNMVSILSPNGTGKNLKDSLSGSQRTRDITIKGKLFVLLWL